MTLREQINEVAQRLDAIAYTNTGYVDFAIRNGRRACHAFAAGHHAGTVEGLPVWPAELYDAYTVMKHLSRNGKIVEDERASEHSGYLRHDNDEIEVWPEIRRYASAKGGIAIRLGLYELGYTHKNLSTSGAHQTRRGVIGDEEAAKVLKVEQRAVKKGWHPCLEQPAKLRRWGQHVRFDSRTLKLEHEHINKLPICSWVPMEPGSPRLQKAFSEAGKQLEDHAVSLAKPQPEPLKYPLVVEKARIPPSSTLHVRTGDRCPAGECWGTLRSCLGGLECPLCWDTLIEEPLSTASEVSVKEPCVYCNGTGVEPSLFFNNPCRRCQ